MEYVILNTLNLKDESEKSYLVEFEDQILWVPKKIIYGWFGYKDVEIAVKSWWAKINNLEGIIFLANQNETQTN